MSACHLAGPTNHSCSSESASKRSKLISEEKHLYEQSVLHQVTKIISILAQRNLHVCESLTAVRGFPEAHTTATKREATSRSACQRKNCPWLLPYKALRKWMWKSRYSLLMPHNRLSERTVDTINPSCKFIGLPEFPTNLKAFLTERLF